MDPVELPFLQEKGPRDATWTAEATYLWLGISEAETFPQEVKEIEECQAKYVAYGGKKCIHVVEPDFIQTSDGQDYTFEQVVEKLSIAYCNVLQEFCRVGLEHGLRRLRLLPISDGVWQDLPQMTAQAVQAAYEQLTEEQKEQLMKCRIELCIFKDPNRFEYPSDFERFSNAIDKAPGHHWSRGAIMGEPGYY